MEGKGFFTFVWAMMFQIWHKKLASKAKIIKWVCVELKIFCPVKGSNQQNKQQSMEWEEIFESHGVVQGLGSKIYEKFMYFM